MNKPLCIGLSACFFHADPQRAIFKGKTLLYLEQSAADWIMSLGALAYMLPPTPKGLGTRAMLGHMDGLVLQAGSDVSPKTYGEEPLQPEWSGDYVRDAYEIELLQECMHLDKPVFGICRGAQLINVAMGGTLYQDVKTQRPDAGDHRDWTTYDQHFHTVEFVPGSRLAATYGGLLRGKVNSVHHQAAKDVGRDLVVEARSTDDDIIEAVRLDLAGSTKPYVMGVQWHPEFLDPNDSTLLDPKPLLREFLGEVDKRR